MGYVGMACKLINNQYLRDQDVPAGFCAQTNGSAASFFFFFLITQISTTPKSGIEKSLSLGLSSNEMFQVLEYKATEESCYWAWVTILTSTYLVFQR
jgi:hypothetical protein